MRYSVCSALIAVLFWAALPLLTLRQPPSTALQDGALSPPAAEWEALSDEAEDTGPSALTGEGEASANKADGFDAAFRLPVLRDGETVQTDLHSYLTGVLLAEMPASFPEEALKAQAVASRTYALSRCAHRRHGDAAVCTDAGCCQAWVDPDTAEPAARSRAEAAVSATDGLAIYYHDALIDATFFSCSGGQTEDAAAVWGSELPYLRSVESPGEEDAAHFQDEIQIPLPEFQAALEALDPEISLSGEPESWIGAVTETPGGGVAEIWLGGRPFSGTALRKCFGLRSTAFCLRLSAEGAVFNTRGNGHRVGMSQYGARAMAEAGNDFLSILRWYYTGVEIHPVPDDAAGLNADSGK